MRQLVPSRDLAEFFASTRRDAQDFLPILVRRLIVATTQPGSLAGLTMPGGDDVRLRGWDGRVLLQSAHEYIPTGNSVWEIGVGNDPKAKANDVYKHRCSDPLGVDPVTSTFVFVTPVVWSGKEEWARARRAEGVWRNVRVIDGAILSEWIDQAPAVGAWFQAQRGSPVGVVEDADAFWRRTIDAEFGAHVTSELIVAGRAKQVERLEEWLKSPAGEICIIGESEQEALAFACAVVRTSVEETRNRVLFANAKECVYYLSALHSPHIVALANPEILPDLKAHPPPMTSLLIPSSRTTPQRQGTRSIELSRPRREELENVLRSMGYGREVAGRIARESLGSVDAVLWAISTQGVGNVPWLKQPIASRLVPLVLAGQWLMVEREENRDHSAVSQLADLPYADVQRLCEEWIAPIGPMQVWGSYWDVKVRRTIWQHLAPFMTPLAIQRFRKVAIEVLGTRDPALDLPAEQRGMASIYKKTHPYSARLRAGLVESVALFSVASDRLAPGIDGKRIAEGIVRALLDNDRLTDSWQSLASWLPELAEASPDVFLAVTERLLDQPEVLKTLSADGGTFAPANCRTHMLWALERLAWSRAYLEQAVVMLGRLAEAGAGEQGGNHPARSLYEILVPWCPSTSAGVEDRVSAFTRLCQVCPNEGWSCGLALLPRDHQTAMPTSRPEFREAGVDRSDSRPTVEESFRFVNAVVDELLRMVGKDPVRWQSLVSVLPLLMNFVPEKAAEVVRAIEALDTQSWTPAERVSLWERLRDMACHHAQYPDAHWSVDAEDLTTLQRLSAKHTPRSPREEYRWLFGSDPTLDGSVRLKWEEEKKKLEDARLTAVRAVLAAHGLDGVLSWADDVEHPEFIGLALAACELSEADAWHVIDDVLLGPSEGESLTARRLCAANFVYGTARAKGERWSLESLQRVRKGGAVSNAVRFTLALSMRIDLWRALEADPGLADEFWRKVPIWYASVEEAEYAVPRLLAAHRRVDAAHVVGTLTFERKREADPPGDDRLLKLALLTMQELPVVTKERDANSLRMSVPNILEFVESRAGKQEEVNRLLLLWEWGLFPILRGSGRGVRFLCRELSRSPDFFVDVLKLLYKRKADAGAESEAQTDAGQPTPEQAKQAAEQAWYLLQDWRTVPGFDTVDGKQAAPSGDAELTATEPAVKGRVDETALRAWVTKTRELAQAVGRIDACDREIGKVFAYSPGDPDGSWPALPVRKLIEELKNPVLDGAMELEIINRRGVHSRGDTGDAERKLRDKYRSQADQARGDSLRVAIILDAVARHYDAEARAEDEEGQRRDYSH